MPTPTDDKVSYQGKPRQQGPSPHSQETPGGATGGGGSGPAAPQPTAQAPMPSGNHRQDNRPSASGARGVNSGLEPGGTSPSNEPLAGEGQIGTPGATSEPGSATKGQDKAQRQAQGRGD